jgi:hypothetical protein
MLRAALTLLSTLQIGATIKDTFDRSLKQAAVLIVAAMFLIAAVVFGLIAAYHALVSIAQFTPAEAAGIMAGLLLLIGLIMLAIVPTIGKRREAPLPSPLASAAQSVNLVDEGVGKAMQQVGPLPLLAIAFLAGIFAGRR